MSNNFAKTICSICHEDFKPLIEDLQAISVCGHVFHELCLQQCFGNESNTKKYCPFCKQSCTSSSANRLYFQLVGDQNESCLSQSDSSTDDPELLRGEVRGLQGRVSSIASISERQENEIKQLNEELNLCREKLINEVVLRSDAVEQKTYIQRALLMKSEELDVVKLERIKMEERSMALSKELAELKLSYAELMAKCNQLGRGEARSSKKLEKAEESIIKLKTRVKELEMLVEVKDNKALRSLKASKKISHKSAVARCSHDKTNSLPAQDLLSQYHSCGHADCLDQSGSLIEDEASVKFNNITHTNSTKEFPSKHKKVDFAEGGAALPFPTIAYVFSECNSKRPTTDNAKPAETMAESVCKASNDVKAHSLAVTDVLLDWRADVNTDKDSRHSDVTDEEDDLIIIDDVKQVQPMINIEKESPSPVPLPKPGDICFSSGLLGPDGANRYLGKWCKRGQSNGLISLGPSLSENFSPAKKSKH